MLSQKLLVRSLSRFKVWRYVFIIQSRSVKRVKLQLSLFGSLSLRVVRSVCSVVTDLGSYHIGPDSSQFIFHLFTKKGIILCLGKCFFYRRAVSFLIRFEVWSFLNFVNLIFSAIWTCLIIWTAHFVNSLFLLYRDIFVWVKSRKRKSINWDFTCYMPV